MRIGDKVVCVDNSNFNGEPGIIYPTKGQIYTIRGIKHTGTLWLCEIVNPVEYYSDGKWEKSWISSRFRPVQYTFGTEVCEAIETEFKKLKEPVTL